MNRKEIEVLVVEALEISRKQAHSPWPAEAMGRYCKIQGILSSAAPRMPGNGNAATRAECLMDSIYTQFVGRTNDLPAYVLVNVFDAIINGSETS